MIVATLAGNWISVGEGAFAGSVCGGASWYGLGGRTASGEEIVPGALTAAHRTLPFGTRVKVENLGNGRTVVVRINDRGPFIRGRMIDLTRAAAEKLGFVRAGVAKVRMTVVGDSAPPLDDSCGTMQIVDEVPIPHERPEGAFSVRFGYAFLSTEQTHGGKSVARELSARFFHESGQLLAAATPGARLTESFADRFGYAFLSSDDGPGARSVARGLAARLAVLGGLAFGI
jgi:rare lipoprotein A